MLNMSLVVGWFGSVPALILDSLLIISIYFYHLVSVRLAETSDGRGGDKMNESSTHSNVSIAVKRTTVDLVRSTLGIFPILAVIRG